MIQEPPVRGARRVLRLRLGDHLIQRSFGDGEIAALQSAVALLRTVFEDHYVDPDHQSFLFFHGCTISGCRGRTEDFNVVHRDGRVILSDFTGHGRGPAVVSLPLYGYATEVLRFAESVAAEPIAVGKLPDWQKRHVEGQWHAFGTLSALTRRFLAEGGVDYQTCCEEFASRHGQLKRPLELQVLGVLGPSAPFRPVSVEARVVFGPVRSRAVLPMRLNRGDMVRATATEFTTGGVVLLLEGVGSGGVCRGDRLYGVQLFYP